VAELKLVGTRTFVVETAHTTATLRYNVDLIYVDLYDRELGETFSFAVYDSIDSRDKLETLINQGVGADADFLRLLQGIQKPETQAGYFAKLARGELTLKELQKAVRLSKSKKFDRNVLRDYRRSAIRLLRPVLVAREGWERTHVAYCKTSDHHVFLMFVGPTLDEESVALLDAIFVSEFGVKVLATNIYSEYAIYKYLLGTDRESLEKWMAKSPEGYLRNVLGWLRRKEENGTLQVIDEELYAFLKSVLSLQIIAC
jgi:hypothetical protein